MLSSIDSISSKIILKKWNDLVHPYSRNKSDK